MKYVYLKNKVYNNFLCVLFFYNQVKFIIEKLISKSKKYATKGTDQL